LSCTVPYIFVLSVRFFVLRVRIKIIIIIIIIISALRTLIIKFNSIRQSSYAKTCFEKRSNLSGHEIKSSPLLLLLLINVFVNAPYVDV